MQDIPKSFDPGTGSGIEQVVTGFRFVEGPVWYPGQNALLFSDIIGDTMYQWSEREGVSVF